MTVTKPETPTLKDINTAAEVAAYLGVDYQFVTRACRTARLQATRKPFTRGRGTWQITREAVEKMIEEASK